MRDLQHRLEAALTDVGRATTALAGAEARAEEAAEESAAAKQDLCVALAEGGAAERRLASVAAAAEVRRGQGSRVPWFMNALKYWLCVTCNTHRVAFELGPTRGTMAGHHTRHILI